MLPARASVLPLRAMVPVGASNLVGPGLDHAPVIGHGAAQQHEYTEFVQFNPFIDSDSDEREGGGDDDDLATNIRKAPTQKTTTKGKSEKKKATKKKAAGPPALEISVDFKPTNYRR
jgi:hypothetical protein